MTNKLADIDRQPLADAREIFGEAFPIPDDTFLERFERHFLDLVEHADQLHAMFGLERREGQRAVAGNNGCHAM